VQFFYAADRGNARVGRSLRCALGADLRAFRYRDKGRPMASRDACAGASPRKPIGALALVAIGYRALSLAALRLGPVKAMLLDLDAGKAAA